MKWILLLGMIGCLNTKIYSQDIPFNKNFLDHLLEKNLNADFGWYASGILSSGKVSQGLADSLHYMLGKLYLDEQPDSSILHLLSVSPLSPALYHRSKKFLLYQYAWKGQFTEARLALGQPSDKIITDSCGYSYLNFALSVLERNESSELPCLAFNQAHNLVIMDKILNKLERKSPLKAALLSGIVPGLGKVYAGRPGQGLMALLSNSVFALQAWEGYNKGGVYDPRFIIFGTLFSVFYVGNIWGSALSVKVNYRQTYDEYKADILATFEWTPGFKSSRP